MPRFPSEEWFAALAEAMNTQPEKYRHLGILDITLIPKITFAGGRAELYSLVFQGYRCCDVRRIDRAQEGRHPVILEGSYETWKEMIENIRAHGGADLEHTLNYLTLPDWPMRLSSPSPEGQLDVDRFYRYNQSLQEFFNEAAQIETQFS